jgi:NAD-dependent deacetylase
VTTLEELLRDAHRVVAFTGAGVSTESGIPDFRSPGGLWSRYDPTRFTFSRYVASPETRAEAWDMRRAFFAHPVHPNAAHRALARLEAAGRSAGVITQNIDGLHQAAGSRKVVEIHGTAREVMCIGSAPKHGVPDGCGWTAPHTWAFDRLDAGDPDPRCPACGGLVKSSTVLFEQVLPQDAIAEAYALAEQADVLVAVGSSLQVYPAAELPLVAFRAGARLAIVNDESTPLDDLATVVVHGKAGPVLDAAVSTVLG